MNRKFVALSSTLIMLAFGLIMVPAYAVDARTIIRGEVKHARIGSPGEDVKSAFGRITVFVVEERAIARVNAVFNIPEDEMMVVVKLVSADSVKLSSVAVSIVGYWDVYVNGELVQDDTYGIFETGAFVGAKLGIDIDEDPTDVGTINAFTKLKAEVTWYRLFE